MHDGRYIVTTPMRLSDSLGVFLSRIIRIVGETYCHASIVRCGLSTSAKESKKSASFSGEPCANLNWIQPSSPDILASD